MMSFGTRKNQRNTDQTLGTGKKFACFHVFLRFICLIELGGEMVMPDRPQNYFPSKNSLHGSCLLKTERRLHLHTALY